MQILSLLNFKEGTIKNVRLTYKMHGARRIFILNFIDQRCGCRTLECYRMR